MVPMNEEPSKGTPADQRDHNEQNESQLLNGVLRLLGYRNAPTNTEIPDSKTKVVGCRRDTNHVKN